MLLWMMAVVLGAPPEPVGPAAADPLDAGAPAPVDESQQHRFLLFPIPLLGYNSDEGLGGGVVISLHHRYGGTDILHDDLSLRIFATTGLVQRHELRWEGTDVLGLPLRMWIRFGFFSTLTQSYCGRGNGVTCDEALARQRASEQGLRKDTKAYDEFVRRFYTMRYVRPHADTLLRWRLQDKPLRIELVGGWRLEYFIPGTLFERGPWPGSLYADVFPRGEPGLSSVPQAGITFDTRDFEPDPSHGVFVEVTGRASHPLLGSAWTWGGVTGIAQFYETVLPSPRSVFATRVLADLIVGDAPVEDIVQVGGTRNFSAFGGQWIGRGVRDRRYLGKLKAINQSELRTDVGGFSFFGVQIDLSVVGFADVGWVAWDWGNLGGAQAGQPWPDGDPLGLVYGFGLGVRALVNRGVVAQAQMAGSPLEQRSPSFYTPVGNSW